LLIDCHVPPGSYLGAADAFPAGPGAPPGYVAWDPKFPGGPPPGPAATSTPIPLLPGDTAIDVRIYLDNTFAEVYLMEGRLALTLTLDGNPISDAAVALFAGSGGPTITASDVYVWPLSSIWVPPAAVLAALDAAPKARFFAAARRTRRDEARVLG
jgi:hypothetical protein